MFACCHRPSVHEYLLIWSSASDDVTFGTLRVICIPQLLGYTLIWCARHPTMPHVAISADTKMASKQTSSDQLVRQKPRKFATENPFRWKCKGRVEQLRQARERRTFSAASQPVVASTSRDLAATSSTQAAVSSDTDTDSSVTVNADNARDNTVADIVASTWSRSEIVLIIGIMYSLYRA